MIKNEIDLPNGNKWFVIEQPKKRMREDLDARLGKTFFPPWYQDKMKKENS